MDQSRSKPSYTSRRSPGRLNGDKAEGTDRPTGCANQADVEKQLLAENLYNHPGEERALVHKHENQQIYPHREMDA